jgi:hypothetical protein
MIMKISCTDRPTGTICQCDFGIPPNDTIVADDNKTTHEEVSHTMTRDLTGKLANIEPFLWFCQCTEQ